MGWSAKLKRPQQKTKLIIRFLLVNAQHLEYPFLYLRAVDTDGSASDFIAV